MKVFKFKGAMLADAAALSDIKNKLNKEQESSVVVVSALKGVMPQLRSLYSQALQKGQGFEEEFKALKDKHLQMAEKLLSGQKKKEYLEALQFHLNELYDTLNQVAVLKDVSHSLKDYVLSKGDILSSLPVILSSRITILEHLKYNGKKVAGLRKKNLKKQEKSLSFPAIVEKPGTAIPYHWDGWDFP